MCVAVGTFCVLILTYSPCVKRTVPLFMKCDLKRFPFLFIIIFQVGG